MKPPHQFDCVVAGDLFQDLIMTGFATWPQPGEEAFAQGFGRDIGGGAAITACGLAKLRARVGVLGAVGAQDGQWLTQRLEHQGVSTDLIAVTDEEPTALTVSISGPAERAYLTYMGANRYLGAMLRRAMDSGEFASARHLHLACAPEAPLLAEICESAKEAGCTVSVDVGWHPEWLADPQAAAALRDVDLFFPNEREAALLSHEEEPERILAKLADMGLRNVVVKRGHRGAAMHANGSVTIQKAWPVDAIDTTGAGDCFDAGFLHAWLGGKDWHTCLKAGVICGSLSTRALGGIKAFPTKEELEMSLCNAKSA